MHSLMFYYFIEINVLISNIHLQLAFAGAASGDMAFACGPSTAIFTQGKQSYATYLLYVIAVKT